MGRAHRSEDGRGARGHVSPTGAVTWTPRAHGDVTRAARAAGTPNVAALPYVGQVGRGLGAYGVALGHRAGRPVTARRPRYSAGERPGDGRTRRSRVSRPVWNEPSGAPARGARLLRVCVPWCRTHRRV